MTSLEEELASALCGIQWKKSGSQFLTASHESKSEAARMAVTYSYGGCSKVFNCVLKFLIKSFFLVKISFFSPAMEWTSELWMSVQISARWKWRGGISLARCDWCYSPTSSSDVTGASLMPFSAFLKALRAKQRRAMWLVTDELSKQRHSRHLVFDRSGSLRQQVIQGGPFKTADSKDL